MEIQDAQRGVRTVFLGGSVGQLVSGLLWLTSASLATWGSHRVAVVLLVVGGAFIFPLTQLILRLSGRPAALRRGHPMNALAIQIAFTLPFTLPLVFAASIYHHAWFYPALMIALGTHYLPFIFLYGMWQFGALAGVLISAGLVIGMYVPANFSLGGWVTSVALLIFAVVGWRVIRTEEFMGHRAALEVATMGGSEPEL